MSANFFWISWLCGQRAVELFSLKGVGARGVPAEFGGAEGAPGDAVTRFVEVAEGLFDPADGSVKNYASR